MKSSLTNSGEEEKHIVIFPFMSKSHILPILDLSIAFARKSLKVSIIVPSSAINFVSETLKGHPEINIIAIKFPKIDGIPDGCESADQLPSQHLHISFTISTKNLSAQFEQIIKEMCESNKKPICLVSDFLLPWNLNICKRFNIPRLVFHGMSGFVIAACKSLLLHKPHVHASSNTVSFRLPDLPFTVTRSEIPMSIENVEHDATMQEFSVEIEESEMNSWGLIVNSFKELETESWSFLQSYYKGRIWCIGPLLLYREMEKKKPHEEEVHECINWLNCCDSENPVLYVSFGTQANVSDEQLTELWHGLVMSNCNFIFVVRSKTWVLPYEEEEEERMKNRSLVVRDWIPQREILAHSKTSGFLSHCGWNSVLESLTMGVPILAWPMIAEQGLNANYIENVLGIGIRIHVSVDGEKKWVKREDVHQGVEQLLHSQRGKLCREQVRKLGRVADAAIQPRGSSDCDLNQLIHELS